jgi:hypothetical protein
MRKGMPSRHKLYLMETKLVEEKDVLIFFQFEQHWFGLCFLCGLGCGRLAISPDTSKTSKTEICQISGLGLLMYLL